MNAALAQATLAWLLTYALHSTVLLVATWLTLRARRFAPAVADVAWKVALVGGMVTSTVQGVAVRQPAGTFFLGSASGEVARGAPRVATPDAAGEERAILAAAQRAEQALLDAAPVSQAPEPSAEVGAPRGDGIEPSRLSPVILAATVWLGCAFALVAWYIGRRLVLVGRLGDRRPVVDGATLATLEELRRDARARRPLRLTSSASISSPVALGGEICLPAAAIAELEHAPLRAMLAHELAHLERRDPAWLAFACVLERAFFFQPLNRLARRGIQENAEFLADEWAARHSGGVPLAKALVKVAEWMQASPLGVPVTGFAEERSQLTVRVTRLLDGVVATPRSRWGPMMLAFGALAVTAAFAPGVSSAAAPRAAVEAQEPERISLPHGRDASTGTVTMPETREGDAPFADTAIVRAVMLRLRDEDAEVRRAAADALGRMRHPMAIDALVIALDDLDGEVRRAALNALGNFESSRVPPAPVRRMLESTDAEMRAYAAHLLGEMRDRVAIPAIVRLLADEQEEVRTAALHALSELEAPIPDDVLTRALADRSNELRQFAAMIAGDRQLVTLVPQLVKLLDDRDRDVRESAAEALTEMRTPASHEALRRALTHKDAAVRRIAVEYFGEEVDK